MSSLEEKIQKIKNLNLPPDKYIIFGGFALELRGLRETEDIDIFVEKKLQ